MSLKLKLFTVVAFLGLLWGFYLLLLPQEFKFKLKEVPFTKATGWQEDTFSESYSALLKSCDLYLNRKGQIHEDIRFGFYEDFYPFCEELKNTEPENIRPVVERKLKLYQVLPPEGKGLFTGYYEPLLKGSFEKSAKYHTPLYPKPKGLYLGKLSDFISDLPEELKDKRLTARVENGQIKPFYTREEIEQGALKEQPLLYVDSAIDAFFLQVQGSGRVQLPTGKIINLGYAEKNGQPYLSIGKYMVEQGYLTLEEVSLESIRTFLQNNPEKQQEILNQNPSYVFFAHKSGGPYGSLGVELTPERSLAIDPKKFPLGIPLFLNSQISEMQKPFRKLMSAQDTGGAIKGVLRGDIYFGETEQAEIFAGHQKAEGELFVLLPNKKAE